MNSTNEALRQSMERLNRLDLAPPFEPGESTGAPLPCPHEDEAMKDESPEPNPPIGGASEPARAASEDAVRPAPSQLAPNQSLETETALPEERGSESSANSLGACASSGSAASLVMKGGHPEPSKQKLIGGASGKSKSSAGGRRPTGAFNNTKKPNPKRKTSDKPQASQKYPPIRTGLDGFCPVQKKRKSTQAPATLLQCLKLRAPDSIKENLLESVQIYPMSIDAPTYFRESGDIHPPEPVHDGTEQHPISVRTLVRYPHIEAFRADTKRILDDASVPVRPRKEVRNPPKEERCSLLPVEAGGKMPVLYRVTSLFNGNVRFLEAVHFEQFMDGRADLRVIRLDRFTLNTDGSVINLELCAQGDLLWVYQICIISEAARQKAATGGFRANSAVDEPDFKPPWVAELVAPLPRDDCIDRICYLLRRVSPAKVDVVIPGNAETCSIYAPDNCPVPLVAPDFARATTRVTEAGWIFPVEPVADSNGYVALVQNVKSLYHSNGPFPVKTVLPELNFRDRCEDRLGPFNAYSAEPEASALLLNQLTAIGSSMRAHCLLDTRKARMDIKVTSLTLSSPHSALIRLEAPKVSMPPSDLNRIVVWKSERNPYLSIIPISIEPVDEEQEHVTIIGTIELEKYLALSACLKKQCLIPAACEFECMAEMFPAPPHVDPVCQMTAFARVGIPESTDERLHLDRLYNPTAIEPVLHAIQRLKVELNDGPPVRLNLDQSTAVQEFLKGRMATVMRSPPGSGKTFTAAAMGMLADSAKHVVMCAVTHSASRNIAVALSKLQTPEDKRAVRLMSAAAFCRLTTDERSPIDLDLHLVEILSHPPPNAFFPDVAFAEAYRLKKERLDELTSQGVNGETMSTQEVRELDTLARAVRKHMNRALQVAIRWAKPNVFVSTVDYALRNLLSTDVTGGVILDEASQITESHLLCIIKAAPKAPLMLVGDPLQLEPYRFNEKLYEQKLAGRSSITIAEKSGGFAVVQLEHVYRAVPSLTELYSTSFYGGDLKAQRKEQGSAILYSAGLVPEASKNPHALVAFPKCVVERTAKNSLRNVAEAKLAVKVAIRLVGAGVNPSDILIVAFYAAQQALCARLFSEAPLLNSCEVLTVDSAQGREKDYVIVLTTRVKAGVLANKFLNDSKRVNVAISRQRDGLIVLGLPELLCSLSSWQHLFWQTKAQKAVHPWLPAVPALQQAPALDSETQFPCIQVD